MVQNVDEFKYITKEDLKRLTGPVRAALPDNQRAKVISRLVAGFEMRGIPRGDRRRDATAYCQRWMKFTELTERGLCSYLRHRYTNYDSLMTKLAELGLMSEVGAWVKLYACCRVIEAAGLALNPLYAAFGDDVLENPQAYAGFDDGRGVYATACAKLGVAR